MLSKTAKYAVRAVIYIAMNEKKGEKIGIKKISAELGIPTPFLGKIMQMLAKQKLLISTKGPYGGFGLGRPAHEISLMNIVELIDDPDNFNYCIIGLSNCNCTEGQQHCKISPSYGCLREELKKLFEKQTIDEIIREIKNSNTQICI